MKYIDLAIIYFKVIQPGKYWSGWFHTLVEVTKASYNYYVNFIVTT